MKLSSRSLYWMTSLVSLVAAGGALMHPIPAVAQERDYLSSPLAQVSPIGKRVVSANLTGGKLSSLQFQQLRRDGTAPDAAPMAEVRFE